ncbi:SMC-Scp complex subunit ScpB [Pelagibius sp. Alg239-R121]|uniref:SMC-Scp complex subunit ScpB n=1 Tax=Pelagibius sp. Alg239-R121 TaxID=2993448 RepID=UPI0024A73746|nr:SMC-Scp complex subunit ScpB [Pelagibius sp. Alg239-R121]
MNERFDQLRLLEAIFFGSPKPIKPDHLKRHLPEGADINGLIIELQALYANRGVNLVQIADCWAFRTAADLAPYMKIETTAVKKLTRAAVETLAIVAYHQPVTRGEIEEIRGVALSKGTLDTLLEAGWIKLKGRRKTPGRPVTWGTTDSFLDHFGLDTVDSLPGIEELKAAGLLDSRPAITALGGRGVLLASGDDGEDIAPEEEDEEADEEEELLPEDFGEPLSAVETSEAADTNEPDQEGGDLGVSESELESEDEAQDVEPVT